MKILYIITKSGAGGAQTHIRQLGKYMEKGGHEVAIMSQPGEWPSGKFYPNPYIKNSFNPFTGVKAIREIKNAVEDFEPDIVSLHSSAAGFWGRLAIKNNIPTIFTAHGWAFTEGAPLLRKIIAMFAEEAVAKYASKIICVSDYDRRLALKYHIAPQDKLVTMHNGVELDNFKYQSSNVNPPAGGPKSKIQIIFIGRLAEPKQQELLLKAIKEVTSNKKQVTSNFEVVFVGDGTKRVELEEYVKEENLEDNVEFLGNLEREEVFDVLRDSDIFVLVSNYEGFPRSILEAMSTGLPIIASDVGGVSEAVDERNGLLIPRGDVSALQDALKKLIIDKNLREQMGQASRMRAEKEFSLEKMINKTIKVYEQEISKAINQENRKTIKNGK